MLPPKRSTDITDDKDNATESWKLRDNLNLQRRQNSMSTFAVFKKQISKQPLYMNKFNIQHFYELNKHFFSLLYGPVLILRASSIDFYLGMSIIGV